MTTDPLLTASKELMRVQMELHLLDEIYRHVNRPKQINYRQSVCHRCKQNTFYTQSMLRYEYQKSNLIRSYNHRALWVQIIDGSCFNPSCDYDLWPWLCRHDDMRDPTRHTIPVIYSSNYTCPRCGISQFAGLKRGTLLTHGECLACHAYLLPGRLGYERFILQLNLRRKFRALHNQQLQLRAFLSSLLSDDNSPCRPSPLALDSFEVQTRMMIDIFFIFW